MTQLTKNNECEKFVIDIRQINALAIYAGLTQERLNTLEIFRSLKPLQEHVNPQKTDENE